MTVFTLESAPKEEVNSLEAWRKELDAYLKVMTNFRSMNHADIFIQLAGYTARASSMRSIVVRQSESRALVAFRTKELDPFIEECERQFKYWSRAFSVQALDWEISKGAV